MPFLQSHRLPGCQDGDSGFLMGVIIWVLPLESFATVFEQLGYLVSDLQINSKTDEFVIALVRCLYEEAADHLEDILDTFDGAF